MPIFNNKFKCCLFYHRNLQIFAIIAIIPAFIGCKSSGDSKVIGKTTNAPPTFITEEPKRMTYQDMIKRFDKNKDGALDDEELADVQKQLGSKPASFSSTSGSDEEIKRAWMIPSKQGSNDSIIDKYDLNRDGVIDENEAELLKKDLREGTPQIKKPSKKQQQPKTPVVNTPVSKTPNRPIVR